MEEKKNLFPSKDTEKKYRNIMILHIQGIVLVIVLMLLLAASFSIMFRSIFTMGIDVVGGMIDMDDIMFLFEEMGFKAMAEGGIGLYKILSVGLNIISYGGAIIAIVATIVIFIQMKKRIAMILDENEEKLNIVKVKKAPYVWLGFLLGAFGGHYFVMRKKKAWIFLLLGFAGMWIFPLVMYTTAISFSDALLACYAWKDHNGYIEIEDYPYWI